MKGEAGGPGQPGQSLKGESGGPAKPGESMKGESGGPAKPGESMKGADAGTSGGPGQPALKDDDAGAMGGPSAGKSAKPEPELKEGEKRGKDGAVLKAGEASAKPEDGGASGGPGAPAAKDGSKPGASGGPSAKKADEDDLVDPDADRPNFGRSADQDGAQDADQHDDEHGDEDDDQDEAFAAVASRAKPPKKDRKPINPAYVTVGVMGLAVLSLAAMIWLGRGILMEMWPGIQGFYASVGVEAARPGDGLRIAESSKRLQRIGGVETLVLRGFISNVSDVPKTVPNLSLQLYNEKKEVIQDVSAAPPSGVLDPGGSVEFDIRLELPDLTAAKGGYAVVWQAE
jgi:hypothetical protein